MVYRCAINQEVFDTLDEKAHYLLGVLNSCAKTKGEELLIYHGNKVLMDLIRRLLGSEHTIHKAKRGVSYNIRAKGVGYLCERLDKLGFATPREERRLPYLEEPFLSHFIRGYIEAQANVSVRNNTARIEMGALNPFKEDLHRRLQLHAHVERGKPVRVLYYAQNDTRRVLEYMYSDESILDYDGTYLPGVRAFLHSDATIDKRGDPTSKLIIAINAMMKGATPTQAAEQAGYAETSGLNRALKGYGTPRQVRRHIIVKMATEIIRRTGEVKNACEELGVHRSYLNRAYRTIHGMTPLEYVKSLTDDPDNA